MKNKIFFMAFLFLSLYQVAFGQFVEIPRPTRYYPLDNMSANDVINNRNNGRIYGGVQSAEDRFFRPAGAMYIRPQSGITIPELTEIYGDMSKGFTLSFWTFIPNIINKNGGVRPWTDTDDIYRYFSINRSEIPLFGFERIRDRAVINRHVFPSRYGQPKEWKLWFWDPTNFTHQTGWFHIVMVCEYSRTRLFIFKPNGEVTSNMHYFRFQNLTEVLTEFGSISNQQGIFLDDFKFYDRSFTREEVMQQHGEDATPQGMYFISNALNKNRFIHTRNSSYNPNTNLEILEYREDLQSRFKWVFEPIEPTKNIYRIRLAYTNLYLGPENNSIAASTTVQIRTGTNEIDLLFREWIVEPVPNEPGYYYIRLSWNPGMYLRTRNNSSNNSTPLELFSFNQAQGESYKWKLNLINTSYELQHIPLANNPYDPKIIVSDINPFLQILPDNPNATSPRYGIINNRWPLAVNNRMLWYLTPSLDGSFFMGSQNPNFSLAPENNNYTNTRVSTRVENFNNNVSHVFKWVMDRSDNIFGSRYKIRLAANPLVQLTAHDFSSRTNNSISGQPGSNLPNEIKAQRWMFFDTQVNASRSVNEQIYHIAPGVYRIQLAADTTVSISSNNRFLPTARLSIKNISRATELSHYWFIDYERTDTGEPIRDGSYLFRMIGTDQYMHTITSRLSSSTGLQLYQLDKNNIEAYKFFIHPEGEGLYSISIAGDRAQLVHPYRSNSTDGTLLEIYPLIDGAAQTFRWRFQKINLNSDIRDGIYSIVSSVNPLLNVSVSSPRNIIRPSDRLMLMQSDPHRIAWNIERDDDGTYMIYLLTNNQRLYARPVNNDILPSTPLEVSSSESTVVRYPYTYRWVVESTSVADVFRFRLVCPTEQLLHIRNNAAVDFAPLEIYWFWSPGPGGFEWKISRLGGVSGANLAE